MDTGPRTARERTRLSALDAVLLAPLAAPFFLLPLGLLVWGVARLATDYVAAVRAPAAAVAWWRWPWGWPGPRVVEALHTGFGAHPVSDLALSGPWPWHLADSFEVAAEAQPVFLQIHIPQLGDKLVGYRMLIGEIENHDKKS